LHDNGDSKYQLPAKLIAKTDTENYRLKEEGSMDKKIRTEKKSWSKPELIVLTRSNPEEMVLVNCKMATGVPDAAHSNRCKANGSACTNNAVGAS